VAERKYAAGTTVTAEKSLAEISELLSKHGVEERVAYQGKVALAVGFAHAGLQYRVEIAIPPLSDFATDSKGFRVDAAKQLALQAQETRRLLRSLVLVVKAKLTGVADGVTTFEKEFLTHIVTEGGQTFGDYALPRIRQAAIAGKIPSALPMPGEGNR